jgi:hypothetical protein
MVSGTVMRNSSQILKNESMADLAEKTTAVASGIETFCKRNSFAVNDSTLKKGIKSMFILCLEISSE